MPRSVFVSYSHKQGEWVWDRLVPVLKAAGVGLFYDRKDFGAARALPRQIAEWQDRADSTLLILSSDHLKSSACQREMDRAIAKDPTFTDRPPLAVPILREDCPLPSSIQAANPLYLDLRDDGEDEPWEKLLDVCEGALDSSPPDWLEARDEIQKYLESNLSVNLVAERGSAWDSLLEQLEHSAVRDLKVVDLYDGRTHGRRGLVEEILRVFGSSQPVPPPPDDLYALDHFISASPRPLRLALAHFDALHNEKRREDYGVELFWALSTLVSKKKKLTLLLSSHESYVNLIPTDHPLSGLLLETVLLGGR